MNKVKVVQLCGKITGLAVDEYTRNFQEAEDSIKTCFPEIVVINPVKLCAHLTIAYGTNEAKYRHYLDICLASIMSIDILVTMENAHDSNGGKEEMKEAFMLGKELMSMEEFLR